MPDASNNLVLYDASLQNPKIVFTCQSGGPNAMCSSVGADKVDSSQLGSYPLEAKNSNNDAFIEVHLNKTGVNGLIRGQGTLLLQISSDGTLIARMQLSPGCDITSTASDGKSLYMLIGQDNRGSGTCNNTPIMQQLPLDGNTAAATMLTPAAFTDTKTGETFSNPVIVDLTQNKVVVETWASSRNTIADRLELVDKTASNLATPCHNVTTARSLLLGSAACARPIKPAAPADAPIAVRRVMFSISSTPLVSRRQESVSIAAAASFQSTQTAWLDYCGCAIGTDNALGCERS